MKCALRCRNLLVMLAMCVAYVCQVVPHAHESDDGRPASPPPHTHHSHGPDGGHHHHHDEEPADDRAHHHHALSWHLDVHFARLVLDSPDTGGADHIPSPAPLLHAGDTPPGACLTEDTPPLHFTPIDPLDARGPPAGA